MAKILLAEDDESMLNFLVMALARVGHDVRSCSDGEEALDLLDQDLGSIVVSPPKPLTK